MKTLTLTITALFLIACSSYSEDLNAEDITIDLEQEEQQIQDAILSTQQLLIGTLMSHVDSVDMTPAVRFCAEHAQHLTDSISEELGYTIRRVSPKNRNPKNEVSKTDFDAFKYFQKTKEEGQMAGSFFDELNQVYYTPIVLGMPLCLSCHGSEETRNTAAYQVIQEYYPTDKAVDYTIGDLRGVWRVSKR